MTTNKGLIGKLLRGALELHNRYAQRRLDRFLGSHRGEPPRKGDPFTLR